MKILLILQIIIYLVCAFIFAWIGHYVLSIFAVVVSALAFCYKISTMKEEND